MIRALSSRITPELMKVVLSARTAGRIASQGAEAAAAISCLVKVRVCARAGNLILILIALGVLQAKKTGWRALTDTPTAVET
jgi:hypothetical protein